MMPTYHDETSLRDMLAERFPTDAPFSVVKLSGGVSSLVFMITNAHGHRFVVKQALAELAVMEHWPAPRSRIFNEIAGMKATCEILGEEHVPEILFVNESEFLYGMKAVPENAVLFKSALLAGDWSTSWFRTAGGLLGRLHNAQCVSPTIREQFGSDSQRLFHDLRLDPYFKHVGRTRPEFASLMAQAVEIASSDSRALVHGDFSPKNIFVSSQSGQLVILDFEVMHWGCPSFDVAFFLTHPLAKAIHLPDQAAKLGEAIRAFWTSYTTHCGTSGARESEVLVLWGAIAIARVAGKSPLEYIHAEREKAALLGWYTVLEKNSIRSIAASADRISRGF